jgi:hypothetical protein
MQEYEVPTYLNANEIEVIPKPEDSRLTCTFTGVLSTYVTGETVRITATARDEFENLRLNIESEFTLKVIGLHTGNEYEATSTPLGHGDYLLTFMFEVVDDYQLRVLLNDEDIVGSPTAEVVVHPSDVQAKYSRLSGVPAEDLVAGNTYTWHIQAQDLHENVVLDSAERFSLTLRSADTEEQASILYNFEYYQAQFTLTSASEYAAMVGLIQRGGLLATYYRTTNFQMPENLIPKHTHPESY